MKMFIAASIFLLSLGAFSRPIFLRDCYNTPYGDAVVSSAYEACLERNYNNIEFALERPIFLSYCTNSMQPQVLWSFENCVNRNFSNIDAGISREHNVQLNLNYCMNAGTDLSFMFENCVRRNFEAISDFFDTI